MSKKIPYKGELLTAAECARAIGITRPSLDYRLKNWPLEKALNPSREKRGKNPVIKQVTNQPYQGRSISEWAIIMGVDLPELEKKLKEGVQISYIVSEFLGKK